MNNGLWTALKRQAWKLSPPECSRHALISIQNQHRCRSCLCCACIEVDAERYLNRLQTRRWYKKQEKWSPMEEDSSDFNEVSQPEFTCMKN